VKLALLPDALVSSVVLAAVYSLIALSWVLLFRSTKVLNFGTGQIFVLGGFVLVSVYAHFGRNLLVALPLTLLVLAAFGGLVPIVVLRRLARQPLFSSVMLTMGLAIMITGLMAITWGTSNRSVPPAGTNTVFHLPGNAFLSTYGLAAIVSALAVFAGVGIFFQRSRMGVQMRAAAEGPLLASQRGVNLTLVYSVSWGMSFVAAAVGGILFSYTNVLSLSSVDIGLRGLAPALIGGLDSIRGALVGALLVAVVESLAVLYLGGEAKSAAAYAVLLAFMAFRPYGLFGSPEIRRV
jgi:branched-chain amino acid transport system permease protein